MAEGEAEHLLEKLIATGREGVSPVSEDSLERELRSRVLPTRADLETLSALLDQLAAEVDGLAGTKSGE